MSLIEITIIHCKCFVPAILELPGQWFAWCSPQLLFWDVFEIIRLFIIAAFTLGCLCSAFVYYACLLIHSSGIISHSYKQAKGPTTACCVCNCVKVIFLRCCFSLIVDLVDVFLFCRACVVFILQLQGQTDCFLHHLIEDVKQVHCNYV